MKIKFKKQDYQTRAVKAIVNCFQGQPLKQGMSYRIDPGADPSDQINPGVDSLHQIKIESDLEGFKNPRLELTEEELLKNIQAVQRGQNLPQSSVLCKDKVCSINLDVEMETGTGKTYCYIKTIFELNRLYGWSKFIVVVPSIAIREGVFKSFNITAEHFLECYGKKIKYFIYNSKELHNIESFSSDAGINVMIINMQAFNSRGKDARRIYEVLDEFQSRRPIDVIKTNNPILILDEPQKIEGKKTKDSLKEFNPLMILRYSATHKIEHNKVHRLDALDAYNQKLVKKISVRGISVKGLSGTNAYLYLESIEISSKMPEARIEFEVKQASGLIKRVVKKLTRGANLYELSNGLDQYRRFVLSEIDAVANRVSFTNGEELMAGEATGDVNEMTLRRIQIREAIKAHFEKERVLFNKGIKVLTLFFIDEVAKYRLYEDGEKKNGDYADIFEEEYINCINEYGFIDNPDYRAYLDGISPSATHEGYFSIDKKSKRMIDPKMNKTESKKGEANDVDAYDLILKDKERLLSREEPVRFIFSHSALREGWDNPNVFVICALKHSDSTVSRRQEVGRGLRISVNQFGDRQDDPATVHDTNVLTFVASESYKDFVSTLQSDIKDSLSERPRVADVKYFTGKIVHSSSGDVEITEKMANEIDFYLVRNGYVNTDRTLSAAYHKELRENKLAPLPDSLLPLSEGVFGLIKSVYSDEGLPDIGNDRNNKSNPLNRKNFNKKEFKKLWNRINKKAVYEVKFDSRELIKKSVSALDEELRVAGLRFSIVEGVQKDKADYDDLNSHESFRVAQRRDETASFSAYSSVRYDLIGKISEATTLTRKTVVAILSGIKKVIFKQFSTNPEHFISEASRIINEQKASVIVHHLTYNPIDESYGVDIFADAQSNQDFKKAGQHLKHHIYDYVVTDSEVERKFVDDLDTSSEVVVYAKLPKGFFIPTPVGNYNPDWAIAFKEGVVKHIYFVAETKGSMSSMELRGVEKIKIDCARKFFSGISDKLASDNVKYDVVNSYDKLMDIVKVSG